VLIEAGTNHCSTEPGFKAIREAHPRAAVIVLLDGDAPERAGEFLRQGADDCLTLDELGTAVARRVVCATVRRHRAGGEPPPAEAPEGTLALMADRIGDMVIVTGTDGTIEFVNSAFEHVTGYTRAEVIGRNPRILKSGCHDAAFYKEMWDTILDGRVFQGAMIDRRKNSELYYHEIAISPLRDLGGRISHFMATARDVSERMKLIESLRESNDRLRKIFDNSSIGMAVIDPQGRYLDCNERFSQMTGYAVEEIQRMKLGNLTPAGDREEARARIAQILSGQNLPYRAERRMARKDGSTYWADVHMDAQHDAQGGIQALLAMIVDITPRKEAERAMRESEEIFRGLVERMHEAVYRATVPGCRYEYISPSAAEVFGYEPERFLNDPLFIAKIIHPDSLAYFEAKWADLQRGIVPPTYEYKIVDGQGQTRWIMQSNEGIYDGQGGIVAIEGLCRNVTEQVRMAEELRRHERLAAIGQTITGVAHFVKNICGNMDASAELLDRALERERMEDARMFWGICRNNCHRMSRLGLEMLHYANSYKLNLRKACLNELILEIEKTCASLAAGSGVALEAQPHPCSIPMIFDYEKIYDVVLNLVHNALDACRETNGGAVRLRTTFDPGRGLVTLSVHDDGPGIPEDIRNKIFEPFFTTKGSRGSGLGLAIAQKIALVHGGSLTVQSQPMDTEFTLQLPLVPADGAEVSDEAPAAGGS
jgi:PAS domain S-box-containing protein